MSRPRSSSTRNERISFLLPKRRPNWRARVSAKTSAWCATVAAASPPPSTSSCCTSWATTTSRFTMARWANGRRINRCPSRRIPSHEANQDMGERSRGCKHKDERNQTFERANLERTKVMSEPVSGPSLPPALGAAIARLHAAMHQVANGDTSGIKALYAHSDDATSFYGWGGYERGWDAVSKRWDWAGRQFKGGTVSYRNPTLVATGELAYTT